MFNSLSISTTSSLLLPSLNKPSILAFPGVSSCLVVLLPSELHLNSRCITSPSLYLLPQHTSWVSEWVKVTQSCPTLCDPMDCVVHGLLQARILEWVSFPFSRGSSQPRDRTRVSCIAGGFFTSWATRKAHKSPPLSSNTILQPQLETCFLCSNIWTAKTGDKGHKINWEWAPRMISAVPDCFSSYPHNNCPKQPRTLPSGLPSLHPF